MIWLDINDSRQMFQGISGDTTTPANVGDVVGTIWNKGSLGGYFSSTATGSRPTLSVVNGRRYLYFGGAHNSFGSSAFFSFSNSVGALCIATSFILPDVTPAGDGQIFAASLASTGSRINIASRVAGIVSAGGRRLDGDTVQDTSASGYTLSDNVLYSLVANYTYSSALLQTYVNGVSYADKNPFQTSGSTTNTNIAAIAIGRYSGGVSSYLTGYLGSLFGKTGAIFTAAEIAAIDAYLRG